MATNTNVGMTDFLNRLTSDPEFRLKFANEDDPEKVQAILKAEGYDFTEEELVKVLQDALARSRGSLSDADLEKVSGGGVLGTVRDAADWVVDNAFRQTGIGPLDDATDFVGKNIGKGIKGIIKLFK